MPETLLLIKPDAVERDLIGAIILRLEAAGFKIVELRLVHLNEAEAQRFYQVHEGKPFFDKLVAFMSSSPIVAMVLARENAVSDLRELVGATDPAQAACGTIRQCFGVDVTRNSVHASDSAETAAVEIKFFFPDR
ncbi:MAG: nucleoside-diphosphate kinase [candidate division Zixibacteria bacterium]|nr:nucleoside-diphosphate kinase [candidate division Zixibacteria bacterium]